MGGAGARSSSSKATRIFVMATSTSTQLNHYSTTNKEVD